MAFIKIENWNDFTRENTQILSFRGTKNLHEKLDKDWILVVDLLAEIPRAAE